MLMIFFFICPISFQKVFIFSFTFANKNVIKKLNEQQLSTTIALALATLIAILLISVLVLANGLPDPVAEEGHPRVDARRGAATAAAKAGQSNHRPLLVNLKGDRAAAVA